MDETNKQMPLEIWTDINGHATRTQFNGGVKYIRAAEYDALREQNRVLAEECDKLRKIIAVAITQLDRLQAALTATSQEGQT